MVMGSIISLGGKTKFTITLDPGVWIFDDRRIDLTTYFTRTTPPEDKHGEYTKAISKQWDREIREGAIYPPTLKSEKKFEKEKVINGTFAMPLADFIEHTEPFEGVKVLTIIQKDATEIDIPLEVAKTTILGFSKNGQPLREDGPVHLYFADGSNQENPIKSIAKLIIK
jgi:hypothetical protein